METLDVRGLPEEKVRQLEQIIKIWKTEAETHEEYDEDVNPTDFIVRDSDIKGTLTRAMAYDHEPNGSDPS